MRQMMIATLLVSLCAALGTGCAGVDQQSYEKTRTQLQACQQTQRAMAERHDQRQQALRRERAEFRKELRLLEQRAGQAERAQAALAQQMLMQNDLQERLNARLGEGQAEVSFRGGMTVIELPAGRIFEAGAPRVTAEGEQTLAGVADTVDEIEDRRIIVAGYDDSPTGARATSNARSLAVLQALEDNGVDPSRMISAGLGNHEPLVDNPAQRSRLSADRVEIILMPDLQTMMVEPAPVEPGSSLTDVGQ